MSGSSSASRFRALSRECDPGVLDLVKVRLAHARDAGLLDSFDGAVTHDGAKLYVMLDSSLVQNRADLDCEEEVAKRVIERAIARASSTLPPRA